MILLWKKHFKWHILSRMDKLDGKKIRDRKRESLKVQIKKDPVLFFVYVILRALVILALVLQFLNRDYYNVFLCVLTLILFLVPSLIERKLKIDIPNVLEVIILIFIFAAEILGEIKSYYVLYPGWDTALHTITGFLAAAVGFSLVDLLNRTSDKLELSPVYLAFVAFCFSMTVACMWEFFEFFMDQVFLTDMQKDYVVSNIHSVALDPTLSNKVVHVKNITSTSVNGIDLGVNGYLDIGLIDTMKDMLVNFIGAVCFSIFGFFYVRGREKGKKSFAENFIPTRIKDGDDKSENAPDGKN